MLYPFELRTHISLVSHIPAVQQTQRALSRMYESQTALLHAFKALPFALRHNLHAAATFALTTDGVLADDGHKLYVAAAFCIRSEGRLYTLTPAFRLTSDADAHAA